VVTLGLHHRSISAVFDCLPQRGYNRRRYGALIPIGRIKNDMSTPPPTQEVFDKLLLCLDPDRERAGEEYEMLRLRLLTYFRSRACLCAEELADESLNRLAQKVAAGEPIREMTRYCYGLARLVWMEYLRDPITKNTSLDDLPALPTLMPDPLLQQERLDCFQHCLRRLTAEERQLIVSYWDHDQQSDSAARREMAARLGISPTALRIRVSRGKKKLKDCYYNCLETGRKR
jgi:DNA-directed RNA polymerase specialized sigma24 family protein